MRIAVISDIHGNLQALDAVLQDISQQNINQMVCLGDVATIGPQPKNVIKRLQETGCTCIMGNHDAALLNPDKADYFQIAQPLLSSLQWCLGQINHTDIEYIKSFHKKFTITNGDNSELLCFHGSPKSNTDIVLVSTADSELTEMFEEETAKMFVGGHTHLQMTLHFKNSQIVNSGSVGCASKKFVGSDGIPELLPWAEYAIIDLNGNNSNIDLRHVSFDLPEIRKILSQSDLPIKEWWLQQYAHS